MLGVGSRDGIPGEMNSSLYEYGIFQYDSGYCIHVGFVTQMLFVYETETMRDAINNNRYMIRPAYQGSIKTAEGYLVPSNSEFITPVDLPPMKEEYKDRDADTSTKGKRALNVVSWCLKDGRIPFRFHVDEITDKEMQIKGNDVIALGSFSIQVKADFLAGPKDKGGSGNLFVQVRESNPHKKY